MAASLVTTIAIPEAYGLRALDAGHRVSDRVWRWRTDAGEVAVKTFGEPELALGQQEAALIAFLGARPDPAYRVQALVATTDGAPWCDQDDQRLVVTRWEAGDYCSYDRYTDVEWAALGRCLAALHRRLDQPGITPLETLSQRLARIDTQAELQRFAALDVGLDEPVARYLATCRELFATCHSLALANFPVDDPQHAIHNDFNQFNYLFGAGLPPLIIDWESSIGAPREFEVVRCLNHLPLRSPALASAFLAGYLAARPLHAGRMRWAVDVACLMHATKHWVLKGWIEGRPGYGERLRGAMEMVAMLAVGREGLADFFTTQVEAAS